MNMKIKIIKLFQKRGLRLLSLVLSLLSASFAFAHDFMVDGIYYDKSGTDAIVTYCGSYASYMDNEYFGTVIIPSNVTYNGVTYKVTSIGDLAFSYCSKLTSVTIPNSVTSIGNCAFSGCSELISVIIPNSVISIGYAAFENCTELMSINIPNSVSSIGVLLFHDCTELTSVTLPNSITTIADGLFLGCSKLSDIIIPNTVTSIGVSAFKGCEQIKNVTIPKSLVSINNLAFSGCNSLTEINIPNSVTFIGVKAFSECKGLMSITVANGNTIYDSRNNCNAIINTATNTLITGCMNTTIPNTVTSISENAFYGCSGLTSVTIPSSVISIGEKAFYSCNGLMSINVVNGNTKYDSRNNCNAIINTATNTLVTGCMNTTIPNSVTSIGENAFYGCSGLTSVTIPSSVTSISNCAFQGCSMLETLNYNAITCANFSPTLIDQPFYNLNITTINIGNGVKKIPAYFANGLSQISNITIPSTVNSIGSSAFADCSGLKSLYCYATNPPVMESSDCFNTYNTISLYVLSPSYYAYNTTNWWNQFNKIYAVDADGNVLATEIILNETNKSLSVNETFKLTATITPDVASNKTVSWTSSNNAVATVDREGLVTALAAGIVRITATTTDGSNLSASCNVSITQLATSISLNETEATMYTGKTLQLTAIVSPSTTSNPSVTWSSSNTSVATVSSTGLVTAKSTGDAVITAKTMDGTNLSASCNVAVKRLATSISLNKTSATLYLDQTVQLTATVSPNNATDRSVVWYSNDNSIATVSPTGLVTAIMPGFATITATTADGSELSATCEITVKAHVTSLTIDPSEVTILEGGTIMLTPTIVPSYATNQNLNWSSSNTSVASVNNGEVIAHTGGEATITARTADGSNLNATCNVSVVPNFDISAPDLSHIRGSLNNKFDLTIDLSNRYEITGMQFDLQLPTDVTIAKDSEDEFNIWLDNARKSRNHTATASLIGGNTYRILVSSATANILKGHSGTVLHIMIGIPVSHVSGNKQIKYSNIILSEPDETRHTLPTKYSMISYYYKEGDANADLGVDVADYVITGNYILQNSPENFWYDAANVDHNSTIDVNDLTGITNIALGRREGGILQMPAIRSSEEDEDVELTANPLVIQAGQTKTLNLSLDGIHDFAGFQMDVQLPEGLRLVDASLSDGDSGLSIATAELADGSIRLLASSFSLKDLAVSNNAFLALTLTAESNFNGNDAITLENIKFSERSMVLHAIDKVVVSVGNESSGLGQVYSVIRIYTNGTNIIIDSPESGTAHITTVSGITQPCDIQPGHNVIPMEDSGIYIVTFNGQTTKLRLN